MASSHPPRVLGDVIARCSWSSLEGQSVTRIGRVREWRPNSRDEESSGRTGGCFYQLQNDLKRGISQANMHGAPT